MHTQGVNCKFLIVLTGAFSVLILRADEKLAVLRTSSEVYSNVTVTTVTKTDIYFTHANGMGNLKIKTLSPELQKHFNFDPHQANEVELKQSDNKNKYHEQLLQKPAVPAPETTS